MPEQAMAQFAKEGQPAFPVADKENDNSSDSPSVEEKETNSDQTQSSDEDKGQTNTENGAEDTTEDDKGDDKGGDKKDKKDRGFADDPRWKKREDDWKKRFNDQEVRHTEETDAKIQKVREEFEQKFTPKKEDSDVEIPGWFGGDKSQYKAYLKDLEAKFDKVREDTLNSVKGASEADQKRIDDATTYMNDQIKEIEEDTDLNPSGKKIDRNKLLKIVLDNKLVDTNSQWNYRAAFQILKASAKPKAKGDDKEDRKKLADVTSGNRAETKPDDVTTSEDFDNPAKRPW